MAATLPSAMPYSVFLSFVHKNIPDVGVPINQMHVTGAFWGLIALWTATNFYCADLIVTVLALVYPAWMSYKAEKEGSYPSQWMAYWVIYAFVYMLEFLQFVVYYIPVFQTMKLVLFLWCMYPSKQNGAELLYGATLKPLLAALDNWVSSHKSSPSPIVEFPKED